MHARTLATSLSIALLLTGASACGDEDPDTIPDRPTPAACSAPQGGPTFHDRDVEGHEVWSADASPHVVTETISVRDGAVLTIEPCAVVQLADGRSIDVAFPGTPTTGTLIAEATADRPIRFEGLDGARWGQLFVQSPGTARLAHVTFDDGGGDGVDPSGATLAAHGDGTLPTQRGLFVDHVTVRGSLGPGVSVRRMAGFVAGSTALVVTGSGDGEHPYPIEIAESALGSLPDGTYTGNLRDEIFVSPESRIQEDATIRDVGVPYHVGSSDRDHLTVGRYDADDDFVTLTIEPGVELAFHPGTSIRIEHSTGDFPATAALVAVGTADRPIVFRSAADAPAPGDWVGLWFGGIVRDETRIRHARIEHTGADCGCVLLTCSDVSQFEGAVIMTQPPPSTFVTDTVISEASAHGFVLGYDGPMLDFEAANTFEDVGGCAMTLPRMSVCPDPRPGCR